MVDTLYVLFILAGYSFLFAISDKNNLFDDLQAEFVFVLLHLF